MKKTMVCLIINFDLIYAKPPLFVFKGVLLGAIALITEMCIKSPDILSHFKKVIFRNQLKPFSNLI